MKVDHAGIHITSNQLQVDYRFYVIPLRQQPNHIFKKTIKMPIKNKTDEEINLDVFFQLNIM